MTSNALRDAAAAASADGFHVGTLLMYVGGALLLAFFSSLGLIARMRERRLDQKRARDAAAVRPPDPGASDPPRP